LEIYLQEKFAIEMINISAKYNVDARIIGHCEASSSKSLIIHHQGEEFQY
jgi:hypothetical protein